MSASMTSDTKESDLGTHVRQKNNITLLPTCINNKDVFESFNRKFREKGNCVIQPKTQGERIVATM